MLGRPGVAVQFVETLDQHLALRNQALRQEAEIDILRLAIMWRARVVRVLRLDVHCLALP